MPALSDSLPTSEVGDESSGAPGNSSSIEFRSPRSFRADLTPDQAIEELAKVLHWKMEHLDPTDQADWNLLDDLDREFYRQCVKAILRQGSLLMASAPYSGIPAMT